jgi:hypothetical protein
VRIYYLVVQYEYNVAFPHNVFTHYVRVAVAVVGVVVVVVVLVGISKVIRV